MKTVIVKPGKMKELHTPAGLIQVIGGQDQFAVRRVGFQANVPDEIYSDKQTLTINNNGRQYRVQAFRTNNELASPIFDSSV